MPRSQPPTPDQIKAARDRLDLTQANLAAALIDATPEEVDRFNQFLTKLNAVRNWEAGRQTPDHFNTPKLRRILHITD